MMRPGRALRSITFALRRHRATRLSRSSASRDMTKRSLYCFEWSAVVTDNAHIILYCGEECGADVSFVSVAIHSCVRARPLASADYEFYENTVRCKICSSAPLRQIACCTLHKNVLATSFRTNKRLPSALECVDTVHPRMASEAEIRLHRANQRFR